MKGEDRVLLHVDVPITDLVTGESLKSLPTLSPQHIARQIQWSAATFGPNVRPGVVEHIKKELVEIEESDYRDTEEWIDVMILAIDGAWRGGATADEIIRVYHDKMEKNFKRKWPDWKTAPEGLAIEHVRDEL